MSSDELSHEEFLLRDGRSIANFLGQGDSDCGYCKRELDGGRRSNNMIAFKLTSNDYQSLLNRGWRRSGTLCYQPQNHPACCPNYPIICKALDFKFSRSKRKCVKNINRFLLSGLYPSEKNSEKNSSPDINYEKHTELIKDTPNVSSTNVVSRFHSRTLDQLRNSNKARDKRFLKSCERKAKLYKISPEEAMKRTLDKVRKSKNSNPSLEHHLFPHKSFLQAEAPVKPRHKLEIKMVHVESKKSREMRQQEHEILMSYQEKIHHEPPSKWDMSKFCDFLVDTPLFAEPIKEPYDYIETSSDLDDTLSVKVYDYESEDDYLLVKPPNLPTAYGSYHCTYHLDDKLIACGVLDVLPECITTVYFFYNPKYDQLNLGIYSTLVEISMIRQMAQRFRGEKNKIVNYHIGYYVHECPKMHYKARYQPSYLLCSETAKYEPTKECLKKLVDGKKYARFSSLEVPNAYKFEPAIEDILKIPISVDVFKNKSQKMLDYFEWLEKNIGKEYVTAIMFNYLTPYIQSVGLELLPNIILQIDRVHRGLLARYLISTEEQARRKF